jgi:spore maturation protein CgeB
VTVEIPLRNILIYGEPYEWAMAYNVQEVCRELGYRAKIFDFTKWLYRTRRASLVNRVRDRLFVSSVARKINSDLVNVLANERFDVLLVMKGVHLFPETIAAAKTQIAHVVNWNPDDFFNPLNSSRSLLASFPLYDCIFTPRRHLIGEYLERGARRVEPLDWYYLPKLYYPVTVSDEEKQRLGSDVVFIGTWSPRREALLGVLAAFDVRIWGAYWERASAKFRKEIDCRPPVFGEDMCRVIRSSKININILTAENRDTTNVRNFEIPSCSGFQLCERSAEIMRLFEEGEEIGFFSGAADLVTQCQRYLDNDEERERVTRQGYERLIGGHHTMKDRVVSLLSALYDDTTLSDAQAARRSTA